MAMSRALKAIVLIVIIVVVVFGVYAAVTYPRTVVSFPMSIDGMTAQKEEKEFDVPWLHGSLQVEIKVESGNVLWSAKITSGDEEIWSHVATQGGQTTYTSRWMEIPAGRYKFTFRTAGIGELDAEIKVTTKGGFW